MRGWWDLLPEVLSHEGERVEGQVVVDDVCHEGQEQDGVDGKAVQDGPLLGNQLHDAVEEEGDEDVDGDAPHGVGDGILALPHHVAQHHGGAVAGEASPGTGHVAVAGNEEDVDGKEYRAAGQGEPGSVDGLVDELVPEGEVEVDAHHDLGCHDDGHHTHAALILLAHDVLQDGQIGHYGQEGQQGEDDEVLHAQGVGLVLVLVPALGKDDGLVGIAEGLGDHGHDHGDLHTAAVYAQQSLALGRVGVDEGEDDLVGRLVQDACHTQDEEGPGVGEHPPEQAAVEVPLHVNELGDEEEGQDARADEVEDEDIGHVARAQHHEVEQVQADIECDEEHLHAGELDGSLLEPQVAEGKGLDDIDAHHHGHHQEIVGMGLVVDGLGQGIDEAKDQCQEEGGENGDEGEAGGEDGVGLLLVLVGKAEEGRLHAEGQDDQDQGHVAVEVGDDAVLAGIEHTGIDGYEQVVEESAHNAG